MKPTILLFFILSLLNSCTSPETNFKNVDDHELQPFSHGVFISDEDSEKDQIKKIANEEAEKNSEEADAKVQQQKNKIKEELFDLKTDQWSGHYFYGDGLGVNVSLDIAPKAGFSFEWRGCLGVYDQNYGKIKEKNNEIHLIFELKNKREGFQGISPTFLRVKWGERRYLIPSDEVIKFCNDINYGGEPREHVHGSFLLREEDHKKKVEGFPDLPKKYRPYLLKQPIIGEIIKIGKISLRKSISDFNFRDIVVSLDVGKKHGILQGMELYMYYPDDKFESVIIKKVTEDSCEAVMTQIGEDDPLPKVGWKFATDSR